MKIFRWLRKQPCIVCNTRQITGAQLVTVWGVIEGVRVGRQIPLCDPCVERFVTQRECDQNQFFPVANKLFDTYEGGPIPLQKQGARGLEIAR